jgi:hypothetical protein
MQKIVFIFIFSILLSSCCTTRLCKIDRAEKKILKLTEKFPELIDKDTILFQDTIRIESVLVDTTFVDDPFLDSDTIIVIKDKIKIKYIRKDSLIYLSGECEGDTIFIEKEIPVEKVIVRERSFAEKAKELTYFIFAIASLLLVIRIFFKDVFKIFNIFK